MSGARNGARFVQAGSVRLHLIDLPGGDPPLVLLHGLSANAHEFGGLIAAGLNPAFRVIAPDLRGRGRSDRPATGYRMADHARDILALLEELGLERVVLGGHSFGAYLAIYIAAMYPERVTRLIVIDAALRLHPKVGEMLRPSLARLERTSPSVAAYLDEVKGAPYLDGAWDPAIEGYYRAEIVEEADGSARSSTSAAAIAQALEGVGAEPWGDLVKRVTQPALLINAVGPYGPPGSIPLVSEEYARETADAIPDCRYVQVPGNHLTMVFGEGAAAITREITAFVRGDGGVRGA
ncbi:MAG TPA: alpha/beta hydrolase [Gemmatimonadales bacterium]